MIEDNTTKRAKPQLARVLLLLSVYFLGLCLPFPKIMRFVGQALVIDIATEIVLLMEVSSIALGVFSVVIIICSLFKETAGQLKTNRIKAIGCLSGVGALVLEIASILYGQQEAARMLSASSTMYWINWPYYSFLPMLFTSFTSAVALAMVIYMPKGITEFLLALTKRRVLSVITLLLYGILALALPMIGAYGYLTGSYLFGRVSPIPVSTETYGLFGRTMVYNLPTEYYSEGLVHGNLLNLTLTIVGEAYFVFTCFALSAIAIGLIGGAFDVIKKRGFKRLLRIGRLCGIASLLAIWFAFVSIYIAMIGHPNYDAYIDISGLWATIIAGLSVNLSTQPAWAESHIVLEGEKHKSNHGFMPRSKKPFDTLMIVILILSSMLVASGMRNIVLDRAPSLDPQENISEALHLYVSKYVVSLEDSSYGYSFGEGYPMYLFVFGEMYYWMYMNTHEEEYKEKMLDLVSSALTIRNSDWTWDISWRHQVSNLYNSQAATLFMYAYNLTSDEEYLTYAKESLHGLLVKGVVQYSGTNDDKLLAFSTLARYLTLVDSDDLLYNLGIKLYNFSISQFQSNTSMWFYSEGDLQSGFYNGRSAFYQIIDVYNLMKQADAIDAIYPTIWSELRNLIPEMVSKSIEFLTSNSTFYYKQETPDYTESAADVLVTLELFDRMNSSNHSVIKATAIRSLLNRQLSNGAFLRTGRLDDGYLIWYTDNIGKSLAHWLFIKSNSTQLRNLAASLRM